jgi:hypothetical protein
MITALLLPFLLGMPAAAPAVRAGSGDDPAIQIWINNDRRFLPGDRAKVQVRTREDGYLLVLHVDPDGHLRVLFPLDPRDDDFIRGGRKYEIRGRGGRESFTADDGKGRGTVYAAVSHDPYRFDEFVLGDHWDYRNLAPQRLPAEPEQDLNDLVRRMADGSFDYDILSYTVLERVVYADDYSTPYYGSSYYGYDGGCGYWYYGCGRSYYGSPYSVSVGLFFGTPRYRRFYDPFYSPFYAAYDPFYDPFFYDPYYYRPYYYSPVYYAPYRSHGYYNYPYYNYPYYGGHYPGSRGWDRPYRPYTPYRFRPADGTLAGYRDRRYDLRRSVNTVYLPPVVRDRQAPNANPIRRLADNPSGGGTDVRPTTAGRGRTVTGDGATARRGPERAPDRAGAGSDSRRVDSRRADSRLERPNIDARRAREPEQARSIMPDARDDRGRRDLPTEVRPLSRSDDAPRRAVEQPREVRAEPQIEARPSRRDDGGARDVGQGDGRAEPRSEPRPDARPSDRGGDRGSYSPPPSDRGGDRGSYSPPSSDRGGDRGSYSPPSRSDGGSRGGSGGSGGSGGGDRGGGRRR